MYGKEEASKLRQQFWITFGRYMKPVPGADGADVNWVNYKTGVKHIYFKMIAEQRRAMIAIEITHPDPGVNELYFSQFLAFKAIFTDAVGEDWDWEARVINDHGVKVGRISKSLSDLSIYDQANWPMLISFLKPRIIALDEFWSNVKPVFEAL